MSAEATLSRDGLACRFGIGLVSLLECLEGPGLECAVTGIAAESHQDPDTYV
jgi:hypothetical protein